MVSERGDFKLEVDGLVVPHDGYLGPTWDPPYLVLAGTRVCVDLKCNACQSSGFVSSECDEAPLAVSGPMQPDGDGCYLATAPGDVEWSVGEPCVREGEAPDRALMRVVAPEAVIAAAEHTLDAWIIRAAASDPGFVSFAGAPWLDEVKWPLQAVVGSQVSTLAVRLRELASDHGVAWERDAGGVEWTTTRGRAPITYPDHGLRFVTFEGTEAEASLRVADQTWSIGQVVSVAPDAVASLEIAGVFYHEEDPDAPVVSRRTYPMFVRVIARDAAGAPVEGVPIRWSIDRGELAVMPNVTGEFAELADECLSPEGRGGPREVVLRASHGDVSAALTLRWTAPEQERDDEWTPSPYCLDPEGCGCRAADPSAAALLVLGLLALRRRRRPHVHRNMAVGACLFVLPLAGCDEDDPPVVGAAEVHELGLLPLDWYAGGGHSVRLGEGALWLLQDEQSHGFALTPDLDARDGLHPLEIGVDDEGSPRDLLPTTDDEREYNSGQACYESQCPRKFLRPGPVVHDPERARLLLFYTKWHRTEPGGDPRYVGSSIAVWRDDLAGRPARPVLAEGAAEPTLLFGADEPRLAAAALVADDHVYTFACDGERNPCILARAPLALAQQRGAWDFYGEGGLWSTARKDALRQFDGAPTLSVHYNAHADVFVAAHVVPGTTRIVIRTAPRLEGPWSDAGEIHRVWQPVPAVAIDGVMFHPELAQEGDRVDYLTYHADAGGLHLLEVRWE